MLSEVRSGGGDVTFDLSGQLVDAGEALLITQLP